MTSIIRALSEFTPSSYLPKPQYRPITYPPTIITLFIPYIITYLVHFPKTRKWRLGILTLQWIGTVWFFLTGKVDDVPLPWLMLIHLSSATRWAFSNSPPSYQPLPRRPFFPKLRSSILFKALDPLLNEYRLISISPYSKTPLTPLQPSPYKWISHMAYHLWNVIFHLIALDLVTYAPYYLEPNGIGAFRRVGGDYHLAIDKAALVFGLPKSVVQMGSAVILIRAIYDGILVAWHVNAFLGIGSGVWLPEEWPALMDRPWLASSVSEFWGKRYHKLLKESFYQVSKPFLVLPQIFHPMIIFLASTIFHGIEMYPICNTPLFYPHASFLLASGVAVTLERIFYRVTGQRVTGWWGRLWTWTWLYLTSIPLCEAYWTIGWGGKLRGSLGEGSGVGPRVVKMLGGGATVV